LPASRPARPAGAGFRAPSGPEDSSRFSQLPHQHRPQHPVLLAVDQKSLQLVEEEDRESSREKKAQSGDTGKANGEHASDGVVGRTPGSGRAERRTHPSQEQRHGRQRCPTGDVGEWSHNRRVDRLADHLERDDAVIHSWACPALTVTGRRSSRSIASPSWLGRSLRSSRTPPTPVPEVPRRTRVRRSRPRFHRCGPNRHRGARPDARADASRDPACCAADPEGRGRADRGRRRDRQRLPPPRSPGVDPRGREASRGAAGSLDNARA
jgi:hypothetical protein